MAKLILALICASVLGVGALYIYSFTLDVPAQAQSIEFPLNGA